MAHIAVALCGGGNRAALFGLGVLLYLADAGTMEIVVSRDGSSYTVHAAGRSRTFSAADAMH